MVRFVYGQITSYPAGEAVDFIRLADELGGGQLRGPGEGEAFAIAGTPEECAERIRDDLVEPGFDHVLLAIADSG